ncbi:MAG: ABC transporter permease [Paracoccaceae bacterium]
MTQDRMGTRRFGAVNWLGLETLALRETRRFLAVWTQTIAAPLVTAGLFLSVFALALGPQRGEVMSAPFIHFLAPGILMMTVIQNAFANTSSSLVISKVQGNIVDTLMPPLAPWELVLGFLAGGAARGALVALAVTLALGVFLGLWPQHPVWLALMVVVGSCLLGALGIAAGIISNKFDQIAAITNFIITPLSFLSGTFYTTATLPPLMAQVSHVNPVFYLIDGARWAYLDRSDSDPLLGLAVTSGTTLAISALAWAWLRRGYRLKP